MLDTIVKGFNAGSDLERARIWCFKGVIISNIKIRIIEMMVLISPNPAPNERSKIPKLASFKAPFAARPNWAKMAAIQTKAIIARNKAVNHSGMNLMWGARC